MTVKILDTGFTDNLREKLIKLSESVKLLSSENFEKISPALIDIERKLESINYMYSGSMINSVDSYKIDKMIHCLKTSRRDYIFVEKTGIVSLEDGVATDQGYYDFEVPDGYLGFNSIVLPFGFMASGLSTDQDTKTTLIWYTKNERTIRFEWRNPMLEQKDLLPYAFDANGYPNRNFVVVIFWR